MRTRLARLSAILVLAWAIAPAAAVAGEYVMDEADIIGAEAEQRIEALSAELEAATPGAELAVLTVPSLEGASIEEFAEERFERLGVGAEDADNGVLLVVAVEDRRMRIEVGYGLEGALPDALAGDVIDTDLTPRFKEGDFTGGIEAAHSRMAGIIAGEYGVELQGLVQPVTTYVDEPPWLPYVVVAVFVIIVFVLISVAVRGNRRGGGGGFGGGWSGGDSGGGGGGFGGGDSGGGGASGGW